MCLVVSDPVALTQPQEITLTSVTYTEPSCFGAADGQIDPVFSSETPIDIYSWNTGWNQRMISNIPADDYTLTITDRNSCTKVENFSLTQPEPITYQSVDLTDPTCFGYKDGQISIAVNGGTGDLSYSVYAGVNAQSSPDFDTLMAGNYVLRITDINDCQSADSSVSLSQPDGVTISSETTEDVTCYGGNDGSITIVASGGAGSLEFSIDDGQNYAANNGLFTDLMAGSYTVRIKDLADCELPGSVLVIADPAAIDITSQTYENVSCIGAGDGSITIVASGGTGSLEFSIDDGQTYTANNGLFADLMAGSYAVRIKDQADCEFPGSVLVIADPTAIDITSQIYENVSCSGAGDGSITIAASGGTGSLEYSIDDGADYLDNNGFFNNLEGGIYNIRVRDENLCDTAGMEITIIDPDAFTIDTTFVIHATSGANGSITLQSTGGITPVTFIAVPPAGDSLTNITGLFSNLAAGNYMLYAIDNNLCVSNTIIVEKFIQNMQTLFLLLQLVFMIGNNTFH